MMKFPAILLVTTLSIFCCHGTSLYNKTKDEQVLGLFPKITWKEVNKTIAFVQNIYARMATREEILGYAQISIEAGTPSHGLFIDSFPYPEATEIMRSSLEAVTATAHVKNEHCTDELSNNQYCEYSLSTIKLSKTALSGACPNLQKECTKEEIYSKYRSMDGSCNNQRKGHDGQSFTAYGRLVKPNYLGGVKELRRSVTKQALPSARIVSSKLERNGEADIKRTLAVLFWGQFVEHDLVHTAMRNMIHTGEPIECCDPDGRKFSPRYEHPFCMPITVPSKDPYYGEKDVTCLSYVRSIPAIGPDCTMGPMEQINQATHFLDGSQIYGSTKPKSDNLRTFTNGSLQTVKTHDFISLPISKNPQWDCQQRAFNAPCYRSGDKRVNSDPHITAMYTIWVREHNRIASQLAAINPSWDDEMIFQETRRIVIAEMQQITYNEWIPSVLGMKITKDHKPIINPSISNEFATVAIRALQSAIIGNLSLKEEEKEFMYRYKPVDSLLKEMTTQNYAGRALYYIGKARETTYGIDILSVDIQRGRDHGLATYNTYREYCELPRVTSFKDLDAIMLPKEVEAIKKSYMSVEDIDLIVGGLAEKPDKGLFGPTISCILKEQFENTKFSDRYFFTSKKQPVPFSEAQLKELKKVSLARIICDNSNTIDRIQPKVFEAISKSNSEDTLCQSKHIPKLNLGLWSVERLSYTQV